MTRTQEQIVARVNAIASDDFFGWQTNDLLIHLDYEHAKEFLKDEIDAGKRAQVIADRKQPSEHIADYMPFAWDKANNCRGISAGRSLEHMKAWVWLDGKDGLLQQIENDYEYYGKPHLVAICEAYGIDWQSLDNDDWCNNEDGPYITAAEALAR